MKPTDPARPTQLTVREARAQIVHSELLKHPELCERLEDIAKMPQIAGWSPAVRDAAVCDLVLEGLLTDDCRGTLVVRRRPERGQA